MGRVDLQVQTYQGKPVLTWWRGRCVGYGSQAVIADISYRTIATDQAAGLSRRPAGSSQRPQARASRRFGPGPST